MDNHGDYFERVGSIDLSGDAWTEQDGLPTLV
jgi:hypothetical protein